MLASNAAYANSGNSFNSGDAKFQSELNKTAIAHFTNVIEHSQNKAKSDLAKVYCNRALAEQAIGESEAANADFKKAIELDPTPKDAIAYTSRGIAKSAIGNIDGAAADFSKASLLSDNSSDQGIYSNNI